MGENLGLAGGFAPLGNNVADDILRDGDGPDGTPVVENVGVGSDVVCEVNPGPIRTQAAELVAGMRFVNHNDQSQIGKVDLLNRAVVTPRNPAVVTGGMVAAVHDAELPCALFVNGDFNAGHHLSGASRARQAVGQQGIIAAKVEHEGVADLGVKSPVNPQGSEGQIIVMGKEVNSLGIGVLEDFNVERDGRFGLVDTAYDSVADLHGSRVTPFRYGTGLADYLGHEESAVGIAVGIAADGGKHPVAVADFLFGNREGKGRCAVGRDIADAEAVSGTFANSRAAGGLGEGVGDALGEVAVLLVVAFRHQSVVNGNDVGGDVAQEAVIRSSVGGHGGFCLNVVIDISGKLDGYLKVTSIRAPDGGRIAGNRHAVVGELAPQTNIEAVDYADGDAIFEHSTGLAVEGHLPVTYIFQSGKGLAEADAGGVADVEYHIEIIALRFGVILNQL